MSMTSKKARKAGYCVCQLGFNRNADDPTVRQTRCRYQFCLSVKCRVCGGEVWGLGPVFCPCETSRKYRFASMQAPGKYVPDRDHPDAVWIETHAAVKPSLAKRRRGHG